MLRTLLFLACLSGLCFAKEYVSTSGLCDKPFAKEELPQCNWYYLVYAPRTFRAATTEKIMVMTHNVSFDVEVQATFLKSRSGQNVVAKSKKFLVKPGALTEVLLKMPNKTPYRDGRLVVEGSGKIPRSIAGDDDSFWKFKNQTDSYSINVEQKGISIFIQTDRPIYKPGETIRMRIVAVNSHLETVKGKISYVVVENSAGSRMVQWTDIDLENGFASLKLPLSIKPVLGDWKIKAAVNGFRKELRIRVAKYVLPKFEVKITPPNFIVLGQERIQGKICAKYSYGKPVVGRVTATFCALRGWYYYYRGSNDRKKCITIRNKRVVGCYDFDLDTDELGLNKGRSYYYSRRFTVSASVTEGATGVVRNATKSETRIQYRKIELSIEGDKDFKPGLPFDIKIKATYPDKSPVEKLKINVTFSVDNKKTIEQQVSIRYGLGDFKVPQIPFKATKLRFQASYQRPVNKRLEYDPVYRRTSSAYLYVDPWYSPSHSYMKIEKPSKELKVGEETALRVHYTAPEPRNVRRTVFYALMCKGNIAAFGSSKKTFKTGSPIPIPATEPTTRPSTPKPEPVPTSVSNMTLNLTTLPPIRTWHPYGRWEIATRPPFPKGFSSGSFELKFKVTQKMVPSCRMLVYYIRGKETVADQVKLNIEKKFANSAQMKFASDEVRPGAQTTLQLSAYPDSIFAVAAVDKSVHFLRKGNELTPGKLMDVLKSLETRPGYVRDDWSRCERFRRRRSIIPFFGDSYSDSEKAFAELGSVFLSNLMVDSRPCADSPIVMPLVVDSVGAGIASVGRTGKPEKTKPKEQKTTSSKPRTDFRETWLWSEERVDSVTGEKKLEVKVPDTITSWYASGFAVSDQAGLGVATPVELRTFKPFFVSLVLPYAVIRGEDVTLPAAVFNYKEKCISFEILLKRSENFRLITTPRATACICSGRTATVLFRIRPKTLGVIPIEVSARTHSKNLCGPGLEVESNLVAVDTVIRKLRVEPEGIEKENVINAFVCPKDDGSELKMKYDLNLPANLVQGSVYSRMSVIGDLMGPSLSNIDQLLAMPYGCGEQNMLKFAPNIFIMQYLKNTYQLNPEIEAKAKEYMLTGYQRELTYKHKDGSYSAFGEGRQNGSMWLTSFVLKSFAEARPFIDIDNSDIDDAKRWIIIHQDGKGCFPTVGKLHNKLMKGGVKSPVTLTAYVLVSLLEADMSVEHPVVQGALGCILPYVRTVNDSYSKALLAYAMAKAGLRTELQIALKRLDEAAIDKDGMRHWGTEEKDDKKDEKWWYRPASSGNIEMTAYALMAYLENDGKESAPNLVSVVKWLSNQRNSLGGWSSTQDTVVAMQALAKYAALVYGKKLDMAITASTTGGFKEAFTLTKENSLILQRAEIEKLPTLLTLKAKGSGCALAQISTKFNVKKDEEDKAFDITVHVSPIKTKRVLRHGKCYSQRIKVCARWLKKGISNMAIINVRMVSGFIPDKTSLDKAVFRSKTLKEHEMKGRDLVLYYSKIVDECVTFKVEQENIVRKTKPVPVTVYDYYDKDKTATKMYEISSKHCVGETLTVS